MGNMSYCRFENTLADMSDCLSALQNGLDVEELSEYEIRALRGFAGMAQAIADYEEQIENVIEEFESINE
jgi:hypothetical protein